MPNQCLGYLTQILSLALVLLTSCSNMNNSHNEPAVECQMPPAGPNETFLRVMDEHGQPLDQGLQFKLQAQFREDGGQTYDLAVSGKACLRLPHAKGRLFVALPDTRAAFVYKHAEDSSQVIHMNLQPSPAFNTFLPCTPEGFFANHQLNHSWALESTINASALKFVVRAVNESNMEATNLFVKDFGAQDLDLPDAFDISSLKEGVYHLEADSYDFLDNFGRTARSLIKSTCPLTVMRQPPLVGDELDSLPTRHVFKPGEALPWKIAGAEAKMFACLEERSGLASPTDLASTSCTPHARCRDQLSFKAVDKLTSDKPGLYDVFAFAKDRAGNVSPTRCQTVAFSATPPVLSLKWGEDSWNTEGSVIRELEVAIKADVSIGAHEVIGQEFLLNSLECKVEFVLQAKDILSGKDVFCTQGKCRGMSLFDYVPCDSHIEFTLHEAWKQKAIQSSSMRLHVRSQDGAGHVYDVSRSVLISSRSWAVEKLEYSPNGTPVGLRQLIRDKDGQYLAIFDDNSIQKWVDEKWQSKSPQDLNLVGANYFFMSGGQGIFAHMRAKIPEHENSVIALFSWDGQNWDPVELPEGVAISKHYGDCSGVLPSNAGFFLQCGEQILHFDGNAWSKPMPMPSSQFETWNCWSTDPFMAEDAQGRLWTVCKDHEIYVLQHNENWQKVTFPLEFEGSVTQLLSDSSSRVWLHVWGGDSTQVGYFTSDTSYHALPLPLDSDGKSLQCYPALDRYERMVCERFYWDLDLNKWMPLPEFANLDFRKYPILFRNNGGMESFSPILSLGGDRNVWAAPGNGIYLTSGSKTIFWPSSVTGAYIHYRSSVYVDKDGTIWMNASVGRDGIMTVQRIRAHRLLILDEKMLGLTHGYMDAPWENAAGELKIVFPDEGLYAFKDGMWQFSSACEAGPCKNWARLEAKDGKVYAAGPHEIWFLRPGDKDYTSIGDPRLKITSIGFVEISDGSIWFANNSKEIGYLYNGKLGFLAIPSPDTTDIAGIIAFHGQPVAITNAGFYKVNLDEPNDPAIRAMNPEDMGLKNFNFGIGVGLMHMGADYHSLHVASADAPVINYLFDPKAQQWRRLDPPPKASGPMSANQNGDIFYLDYELKNVFKKNADDTWTQVLSLATYNQYIGVPEGGYIYEMFVDKYGRAWLLSLNPYLLTRLDP